VTFVSWEAWVVLVATGTAFVSMVRGWAPAEIALGVSLAAITLLGVLEPRQALAGFANEQLHTVALLFVAAAALRGAGSLGMLTSRFLTPTTSVSLAVLRLTLPVALLSGVLNNTPIVAMLIPEVRAWALRTGISSSRLLIPLSYAAIVGGLITVIGTSTNLVVNGLVAEVGRQPIGFLEIGRIGLPLTIVTLAFLTISARWLLPDRPDVDAAFSNPQTFTTEILIDADGPYAGRRLADIRVHDLPPLAPVEIERGGQVIPAPRPDHVLQGGDRLVFAGPSAALLALRSHPGLSLARDHAFHLDNPQRHFVELLVSPRCPLIGRRVGDGTFRQRYNAAVIAVARHGERVANARLGDWELRAGDILLVEVGADFFARHRSSADFYLVTPRGAPPVVHRLRAWLGLVILGGMVGAAATGMLSMFKAALLAVGVLAAARYLTRDLVREGLDVRVLLTIALSFGLGVALERSGAAAGLASTVELFGDRSPWLALAVVYLATVAVTEMITNNAAAALMIPVAFAVADRLGVSYVPFTIVVMVAASASFVTPIGYTTNLMVYGPGGYRFTDFARAGIPLAILTALITLFLTPLIWPF
jgi:di/tricarboxylate transporter